ncbi:hypothetical protein D3C87_1347930 [compost metagenome]
MEIYRNLGGTSNVSSFDIGVDYIAVRFNRTARVYRYSYGRAGQQHVENMKQLARQGSGLNSYINRQTKYLYD